MPPRKTSYQSELDDLQRQSDRLDAEMAVVAEKLAKLGRRRERVLSRMLQLRVAMGNPLGLPSSKSRGIYQAWDALKRATEDAFGRPGVTPDDVLKEFPDLKRETLRSYLRRMKAAGLIEKKGAYWRPVALDERGGAGPVK